MNSDSLPSPARGQARGSAGAPTRARLITAATAIIAEGGYAAASVKAVSARADVATGALYRHFPSKAALFAEVFRDVAERELAAARDAAEDHDDPVEALVAALSAFARRALRVPQMAWALLGEPVDPLVEAERLAYRRRHVTAFADLVARGVAAGQLPPQQPGVTASALVGAAAEVLIGPLAASDDPDTLVDELNALARRTVGAATPSRAHEPKEPR